MSKDRLGFEVKLNLEGVDGIDQTPQLEAYVFDGRGGFIGSSPVKESSAHLPLGRELAGRNLRLLIAPPLDQRQEAPTIAELKRMGAYEQNFRWQLRTPSIEITLDESILQNLIFCRCRVRGRLIKRITMPDGTTRELPVSNARVTIYEVDPFPLIIERLPDPDIFRLRDELFDLIRRPIPIPDPPPYFDLREIGTLPNPVSARALNPQPLPPKAGIGSLRTNSVLARSSSNGTQTGESLSESRTAFNLSLTERIQPLALTTSALDLRRSLIDLSDLILPYICLLHWLHPFYRKDFIRTVLVDDQGRFDTTIGYPCFGDHPDLYFKVEQLQEGTWVTVYNPPLACNIWWNYECGTEVVLNVPNAVPNVPDPVVEVPPGVTTWVLPFSVGDTFIWGTPPGSPDAPLGWVQSDGFTDYNWGSLGLVRSAPFGSTLGFRMLESFYIPTNALKYYRFSFRKVGTADWTPITTTITRRYQREVPGELPTFPAYALGPKSVGAVTNLFEFKPVNPPPPDASDPAGTIHVWPTDNVFGDIYAAIWDTDAPPFNDPAAAAGQYEVKLEVFDSAGTLVAPGASTFQFVALNADTTTTRLATPAEISGAAFVFRLQIDNNPVDADLPQPMIDGAGADPDCGFLFYTPSSSAVSVSFCASHPNDHALFSFGINRGSHPALSATIPTPPAMSGLTLPEVGATPAGAYTLQGDGYYHADFSRSTLLETCTNGAFAAALNVYGKATNGSARIGYDATLLIAFALAEA
ncbi:MAG: hypothetical protein IAE80_14380 [Anaerolinea sp.]|nr:hypothetical protein [Anaerolinea sp.]